MNIFNLFSHAGSQNSRNGWKRNMKKQETNFLHWYVIKKQH